MRRLRGSGLAAEESGFTIVEVVVAAVILATAALASTEVMINSTKANFRAEQNQVAIDRAQAELEKVRTLGFDQVALNTAPPGSPPGGPGDRLAPTCANQGVSLNGCFALNENGSNMAPLVVAGGVVEAGGLVSGAAIDPGPEPFTSGDISGEIYRFVVWQNDYACPETQCPGMQDRKRVSVVVTLDRGAGSTDRAYRELQSDFIDPDLGKEIAPQPAPPVETSKQQIWLTDTTCNLLGRILPQSDHPLHNTLGRCVGLQPPDLMLPEPPGIDVLFPPELQPEYDFATDVEPLTGGDSDTGTIIRRDDSGSCLFDPPSPAAREKTHRWVMEPVKPGSSLVLEGNATLELFTQTLGGARASGKICVFLFIREEQLVGPPVDTMIGDAENSGLPFFTFESADWPSGGWDAVTLPMQLEPPSPGDSNVILLPGQRLGLAVTVEASTTVDALQIAYEHTDFDSRLELETASTLP